MKLLLHIQQLQWWLLINQSLTLKNTYYHLNLNLKLCLLTQLNPLTKTVYDSCLQTKHSYICSVENGQGLTIKVVDIFDFQSKFEPRYSSHLRTYFVYLLSLYTFFMCQNLLRIIMFSLSFSLKLVILNLRFLSKSFFLGNIYIHNTMFR